MRVIKNNAISSITASSSDAGHPVSNLLNDSPKKRWTAADTTVDAVTVDIEISGTTDSIGIIGVSADSVTVSISDPNGIVWENVWWPDVSWVDSQDAVNVEYLVTPETQGKFNLWIDFSQFTAAVTIQLYFTKNYALAPSLLIGAGVVVVGVAEIFPNPNYGITEGIVDFSLTRELSNGATYYKPRDRVRKFSGEMIVNRESDFYRMFYDIARDYGSQPMMWYLIENMGNKWIVYGRLISMPEGSHAYLNHSVIGFEIMEVL